MNLPFSKILVNDYWRLIFEKPIDATADIFDVRISRLKIQLSLFVAEFSAAKSGGIVSASRLFMQNLDTEGSRMALRFGNILSLPDNKKSAEPFISGSAHVLWIIA